MSAFTLQPGDEVQYNRHAYRIQAAVSLTTVRIEDCSTGETRVVPVTALEASDAQTATSTGDDISHAPDIMQIAEADWAEAKRRVQILAPLATLDLCPQSVVQKAATDIGCSVRHLYTLLRAYRASGGTLSALVPSKHSGGKGKGRLSADLEAIIATTVEEKYLTPQKRTVQRIVDEVRRRPGWTEGVLHRLDRLKGRQEVEFVPQDRVLHTAQTVQGLWPQLLAGDHLPA